MAAILIAAITLNAVIAFGCALVAQSWRGTITRPRHDEAVALARTLSVHPGELIGRGSGRVEQLGYREIRVGSFGSVGLQIPEWITMAEVEAGWPLKAFHRTILYTQDHRTWLRYYSSGPNIESQIVGEFILPTTPRWSGFIVNATIYAVVLWMFLVMPGPICGIVRARRGRCPACAYPVGTNERCTECGKPVPATARRRARTAGASPSPASQPR